MLHGVAGPRGTRIGNLLAGGLPTVARFRPLVGRFDRMIASVSGPPELIEAAVQGLPHGAARAEALAVRLKRDGIALAWGEPEIVVSAGQVLELLLRARAVLDRGRQKRSLAGDRAPARRLVRFRLAVARPAPPEPPDPPPTYDDARPDGQSLRLAADLAFWRGVRAGATPEEWRRLRAARTWCSSITASRESANLARNASTSHRPRSPASSRLLRLTGFRHLGVDELLAFHERVDAVLPRRRFVVTVDDALRDCRAPLERHGQAGMHLYVPTAEIEGAAHWLDGEPLLSWSEIRSLAAAGIEVGAHARHHRRLERPHRRPNSSTS